jgi:hypothetical protein
MNKLMYDSCATADRTMRSVAPSCFAMDINYYENDSKCRPQLGIIGGTNVSHGERQLLVDVESNLQGRTYPATLCPSYQNGPAVDGLLRPVEYIKPVTHPAIDMVHKKHLPSCSTRLLSAPDWRAIGLGGGRGCPR